MPVLASVRRAAARIIELGLPLAGLLDNAGVPASRLLAKYLLSPLAPFIRYWSNPRTAARVITQVLTDDSGRTGVCYDQNGRPMNGSTLVRELEFDQRVVAETRALLARVPA